MSQVHAVYDDAGRGFRYSEKEGIAGEFLPWSLRPTLEGLLGQVESADDLTGLRHLLPHHQLPFRIDVEAQAGRFHHSVHGRCGQGDFGDEVKFER